MAPPLGLGPEADLPGWSRRRGEAALLLRRQKEDGTQAAALQEGRGQDNTHYINRSGEERLHPEEGQGRARNHAAGPEIPGRPGEAAEINFIDAYKNLSAIFFPWIKQRMNGAIKR